MRGRLRKYEHEPWRNVLPVHPAAELLPPLSADELQELGEDIRARGLLVPIVLYLDPDGGLSLLDGRNRLDAMERVGIEFVIIATPPSTATLMGDVLNPAGKTSYAQTYPVGFTPLFHHERLDAPRNTKVPEQAKTDSRYGRSVISSVRCKIITPK